MTRFDVEVTSKLVAPWDSARMAENFSRIEQRIRLQKSSRRRTIVLAAVVASAAFFVIGFGLWRAQTARYAATSSPTAATTTRFGDGSTATALTDDAVLELQKTSATEIVVAAKSGSYRFDVTPNPARRFTVRVAEVTVRVLGTRFVVAKTNQRVEVRVERGRVEVSWPTGRTELGVAESGWFPPDAPAVTPTASASLISTTEIPAGAEAPRVSAATEFANASAKNSATSERSRVRELSRKGNYQAAFAIVDRAPQLFEGSAEDLMLAADAARLSDHPARAVPYLQRITTAHARDTRAPLAAFALGRIYMNQLGQPQAAARAFALVRQLAPSGALVEDALARETEALERAGQHAAAQRAAAEYLGKYPTGRRSEKLRQLGTLGKAPKSE